MSDIEDIRASAILRPRGNLFEDFHVGQIFDHHWGRTISEADTIQFTTLTLSFNPLYTNREFARAHGHPDLVVNPLLVFNVVLGLSVEDCSEIGGPFLGVFDLRYHRPVYPGDTITAHSQTTEVRRSVSNPENGIVTWLTRGMNQKEECVVGFRRTNIVRLRIPAVENAR